MKSRKLRETDAPGTVVWLVEDDGTVTQTKTRSEQWMLCGQRVVKVEGRAGGYSVDRLSVPQE